MREIASLWENSNGVLHNLFITKSYTGFTKPSYVLETGLPVFYLGGFGGQDPVIDADGIAKLVANKELRFLLLV